jgi:hypothetical protein
MSQRGAALAREFPLALITPPITSFEYLCQHPEAAAAVGSRNAADPS